MEKTVKQIEVLIGKCSTIKDLTSLELDSDERVGVQKALARKIKEIEEENNSDVNTAPEMATDLITETEEESEEEIELTEEEQKILKFRSMIPYNCRCSNIISGADDFFGETLKKSEFNHETGVVKIYLKSKTKFEVRGV